MEEYKPNSHKSKEEQKDLVPEKRVEKVISGTVKPKKKSEMQKFADVFISEDVNNVKSYIVMDVLVPAIKKAISDIVTNGIDMILYGEAGSRKRIRQRPRYPIRSITTAERRIIRHRRVGRAMNMMNSYLKLVGMLNRYWTL